MISLFKKILFTVILLFSYSQAENNFEPSTTCKGCHPIIYNEFYDSSHRKSSIYTNKIHKAIWEAQVKKEDSSYTCAKCHTPTDLKLINDLKDENILAKPQENSIQTQDAISCVYCHSIEKIEEHEKQNINILSNKDKTMFAANEKNRNKKEVSFKEEISMLGMMKKKTGSPFHKIDYSNKDYYTGNTCMGCHSHMKNHRGIEVFEVEKAGAKDLETNCITCHMPKVQGTMTTIKQTKEHRFHGFAGAHFKQELLSKYIKLKFQPENNHFNIAIKNEASHDMFLHPLRVAVLNVEIFRNNQIIKLEPKIFKKTIQRVENPNTYKSNMIKANENRIINYNFKLESNDKVSTVFGYYLVNPKIIDKLKLENDLDSTKFYLLKKEFFNYN